MSRVANRIIDLPSGVSVSVAAGNVTVKGAKGALTMAIGPGVSVEQQDKKLSVKYEGTSRRA
jgi:large subunit ribosomal protein L6